MAKLDLTGYWLQLPDLITLGDYLAVVPVKELVMENCGLTDEGVRVILAGLLAAKCPDWERKKAKKGKWGEVPQGGFVERVVFKNNTKIGKDGWRYICTFITMCRSLKCNGFIKGPIPSALSRNSITKVLIDPLTYKRIQAINNHPEVACVLSKAIGERLAGREFELLNIAECGMTTEQLGYLIDGVIKSGLRRLGLAGNNITSEGMQHVARYIRDGKCEGLDLGGNDLKDQLGVIAGALTEDNALYALSLADCNLTPDSLWALFPALAKLSNFRFIDLSQNHDLFDSDPSALSLLRRYVVFHYAVSSQNMQIRVLAGSGNRRGWLMRLKTPRDQADTSPFLGLQPAHFSPRVARQSRQLKMALACRSNNLIMLILIMMI